METTGNNRATERSAESRFRNLACWLAGLVMIVGGSFKVGLHAGWLNEQIHGLLAVAGGVCVIPPVLRRLRQRWSMIRPPWVPVLIFAAVAVVAPLLLTPLAPSQQEQAGYVREALVAAEKRASAGDFLGARQLLRRFTLQSDVPAPVRRALDRIEKAEQSAVALATPRTKAPPTRVASNKSGTASLTEGAIPDPANVYVERIETYWLPQVRALPHVPPAGSQYGRLLTQMDGLRSYVSDGEQLTLTARQKAVCESACNIDPVRG